MALLVMVWIAGFLLTLKAFCFLNQYVCGVLFPDDINPSTGNAVPLTPAVWNDNRLVVCARKIQVFYKYLLLQVHPHTYAQHLVYVELEG